MAKHTITYEELKTYSFETLIAASSSDSKSLKACVHIINSRIYFQVTSHKVVMMETGILERAINCYNEL